jgi:hypothetical protein
MSSRRDEFGKHIIDAQRTVGSGETRSGLRGRREFRDLLARQACAANCDMLEDGPNGQNIPAVGLTAVTCSCSDIQGKCVAHVVSASIKRHACLVTKSTKHLSNRRHHSTSASPHDAAPCVSDWLFCSLGYIKQLTNVEWDQVTLCQTVVLGS